MRKRIDLYNEIVHEDWHWNKKDFYERMMVKSEFAAKMQGNLRMEKAKNKIKAGGIGCGCCK